MLVTRFLICFPNVSFSPVAKFANACIQQVKELTRQLEVTLGPDTAEIVSDGG